MLRYRFPGPSRIAHQSFVYCLTSFSTLGGRRGIPPGRTGSTIVTPLPKDFQTWLCALVLSQIFWKLGIDYHHICPPPPSPLSNMEIPSYAKIHDTKCTSSSGAFSGGQLEIKLSGVTTGTFRTIKAGFPQVLRHQFSRLSRLLGLEKYIIFPDITLKIIFFFQT